MYKEECEGSKDLKMRMSAAFSCNNNNEIQRHSYYKGIIKYKDLFFFKKEIQRKTSSRVGIVAHDAFYLFA
jgi:hypothetical protein